MAEAGALPEEAEGHWTVSDGIPASREPAAKEWAGDAENLTYNNPFNLELERVWFDGKIVFAVELGELDVNPADLKVAQEYQVVYEVHLDDQGKPKLEPERVPGQYNIYDSIPGMKDYSPLWQFNYVVVPREFEPNSLRSEQDCLRSGFPIMRSSVVEN